MTSSETEHKHRWVPDRERTGFTSPDHPGESGWDWHVDEVRRLRAQVKAQEEVVEAARDAVGGSMAGTAVLRDKLARLDVVTAAKGVSRE